MRDLICAHSSHGQLTVRYSQYHVKMGMQRERDSRKHQQKHKIYTKDVRKKQRHEAGSDKKQRLKLNNIEMCVVITGYVIGKKKKIYTNRYHTKDAFRRTSQNFKQAASSCLSICGSCNQSASSSNYTIANGKTTSHRLERMRKEAVVAYLKAGVHKT